jgi:branched-chain amino acid transport system permease protein
MAGRLLRVLYAAAGAFLLSWPLVALDGDERRGFSAASGPALQVFVGILEAQSRLAARRGGAPRHAAGPGLFRKWGVAGALFAALALFPLFRPPADPSLGLVLDTMTFATIALGLNITIGMAGILVLGHAAFWAVGAYTFVLLTVHLHWNFWFAFPAAGVAAAAVGFVIGLPALRLRGDYLAVPGSEIRGNLWEAQGALGEWLWQPGTGNVLRECYWFALALLAACVVCVRLLSDSRIGRALYALREDETAARCMGIDTVKVKLIAFTSSAMWAGLAGVVTAEYRGSISPDLFDFNMSVLFVAMVVLGGLGSVWGSVLGATLLWALPVLLQQHFPDVQRYRMLVFGAVMCAMMVVKPEGLLGRRGGR